MTESRSLFTAVFERYEESKELFKRKTHFRDVRVREGGLVSRKLVFDEEVSNKIIGHLTFGEYIAFIADIEFKNIEFQHPHS
jgi:3-phenylpropionate/cinnamic acid dioxygenase small subunit